MKAIIDNKRVVKCPHCGSGDCAGLSTPNPRTAKIICCKTGKEITKDAHDSQLAPPTMGDSEDEQRRKRAYGHEA